MRTNLEVAAVHVYAGCTARVSIVERTRVRHHGFASRIRILSCLNRETLCGVISGSLLATAGSVEGGGTLGRRSSTTPPVKLSNESPLYDATRTPSIRGVLRAARGSSGLSSDSKYTRRVCEELGVSVFRIPVSACLWVLIHVHVLV
jgi:hypothetical protein